MKKTIVFAGLVFAGLFAITGCVKERVCHIHHDVGDDIPKDVGSMVAYWRWREDATRVRDWDGDPAGLPMPYSGGGYWPMNMVSVNHFYENWLQYYRENGLTYPDWLTVPEVPEVMEE